MKVNTITAYPTVMRKRVMSDGTTPEIESAKTNSLSGMFFVSFKGNPQKHPEQIANMATEKKMLGGIYVAGGLGSVADSISPAVIKEGRQYTICNKTPDIRDFYPYYTYNASADNAGNEGKIYILTKDGAERAAKGENLDIARDFKLENPSYKVQNGEKYSVITDVKNGKIKYFTLKDTEISGTIERVKRDAFEMEKIPYRTFELELSDAERLAHPEKTYLVHTPEMARGGKAYGWCDLYKHERTPGESSSKFTGSTAYAGSKPDATGKLIGRSSNDLFTTDFTRAVEDALTKMDTEAHGHFNPQNIGINDRFGVVFITDMLEKVQAGDKYWDGIRNSVFFHNIGRFYQGAYANPVDFFKLIATKEDLEKLKSNPHFDKVEEIANKIAKGIATEEESQKIYNFFKPYFHNFIDTENTFNMTMIAVASTKEYPDNVVPGNVSRNFGKETRDLNTDDIAKGLTAKLKEIEAYTKDIVNGESVATMATENQNGFFGRGGLEKIFNDVNNPRHYVPYSRTDSIDQIFDAKLTNKRNFIDIIAEATEKLGSDKDAVSKMIIENGFIDKCRKAGETEAFTLGGFSKYSNGDILMMSWGRPDSQKGFPIALNGFKKFLQDESVPLETRKHCKFVLGGGGGGSYFRNDGNKINEEWQLIKDAIKDIENISVAGEKGVFKGNVLYVNGIMPNRIANCADLGVFTSRFEPCGVTPLECYAAGTPVASVRTGGAADFVTNEVGYLTKEPYMLSRKALGLDSTISEEALEKARLEHTSTDVAEMLKKYVEPAKDGSFEVKQKDYIKNTLNQAIGWDQNLEYNGGKSALNKHMTERWRCQDNNVSTGAKKSLFGEFDNSVFESTNKPTPENPAGKTGGWWHNLSKGGKTGIITGCVVLGALATYAICNSVNKNKTQTQVQTVPNNTVDVEYEEEDI